MGDLLYERKYMKLSKAEIDRLGDSVRIEKNTLGEDVLNRLQAYRISHKEVLSFTFNMLCTKSKKIHTSAIVTYRIKRFESIIGKLNRYPDMRFSRMWDIGGCRCILRNNEEVYKLKDLILKEESFEIIKEYDYIANPQDNGYKSLHIFLKHKDFDRIIEVQLRNQTNHDWATLVEITDVLFDVKVKELGDNKEFLRFHYLLSKLNDLDMNNKREISRVLTKYNYFETLSEVFSRNYIGVRRGWFEIESKDKHKFFMIETNKDDVPKIQSFKNSTEAEESYFNVYKTKSNANIVLTHLQSPSYKHISIAYSNYLLTFHTFLDECYEILESLIIESLSRKKYYQYFKMYKLYNSLIYSYVSNLAAEFREVAMYSEETKNKKQRDRKKEREWASDIKKKMNTSSARGKKLAQNFKKNKPKSKIGIFIVRKITRFIEKKYRKKIENLLG